MVGVYIREILAGKMLEIQLTLISDGSTGERCSCCRSPLFVAFKLSDIHRFSPLVLFIKLTFHP